MLARQIAIGFGIAIIFPLLVYNGTATLYPPPNRQNTSVVVASLSGPNATPEERQKYKEEQQKRQEEQRKLNDEYNAAARNFARHLVTISTSLGVAAILIGAYIPPYAIGTGLIFGGIFSVGTSYWVSWDYVDEWIRFASLLAGLLVLLFVGYFRVARGTSP